MLDLSSKFGVHSLDCFREVFLFFTDGRTNDDERTVALLYSNAKHRRSTGL